MLIEDFGACEICNSLSWVKVYEGLGHNDAFGQFTESTFVAKCYGYGIERLSENIAKRSNDFYETKEYRSLLRNRSPATQLALLFFKKLSDDFWDRALEAQDEGDYLYAFQSRPD